MGRFLLLSFLFLCSISGTNAQCLSGNCKNGTGTLKLPNGAIFQGEFLEGEIGTKGTLRYPDGTTYKGEFQNRRFEGKGTMLFPDGTAISGFFKNGLPVDRMSEFTAKAAGPFDGQAVQTGCVSGNCENDKGTLLYADGSKYIGGFLNKKPHGSGQMWYADNSYYSGQFKEGFRHGEGVLYLADKTQTSGEWNLNEYVGFKAKETERGCVSGDCIDGEGKYVYDNASYYVGQFKHGLEDGQGTFYYSNGSRYIGSWKAGNCHGFGMLTEPPSRPFEGYWENGNFVGLHHEYKTMVQSEDDTPVPNINADPEQQEDTHIAPTPPQPAPKPAAKIAKKPKVWAVIVGVATYQNMPVLRYPDDDAYLIYGFLRGVEGGSLPENQIRLLINENATHDSILNAIKKIKCAPEDLLIVYFSGHGIKGAFLPTDYDGYSNKLMHNELSDAISKLPCKRKFVMVDACNSGGLMAARDGAESTVRYYDKLAQSSPGIAFLLSSRPNENSLESGGMRHGVFSHYLIEGLRGAADSDSDGFVTIQELSDYVIPNVEIYTGNQQMPILTGDYDANMPVSVVSD